MTTQVDFREMRASRLARSVFFALLFCITLAPTIKQAIDSLSGRTADSLTGEGNPVRMLLYAAICTLTLYCVAVSRSPRAWWPVPPAFTAALLWFAASALWALNPGVGARRLILTTAIIWSVFSLVQRIGYEGVLSSLRTLLPLILLGNFAAVFFVPSLGITEASAHESIAGAWRGILVDKNYAGPVCAFTLFIFALDAAHLLRVYRVIVLAAAAYFLYRTGSKTSMGLVAVSLCVAYAFRRYDPYYRLILAALIAAAILVVVVVLFGNRDAILQATAVFFEDPDSLTGRVQIWPLLLEFAKDNLLLGAGFGSFWNIGSASPIFAESDNWISTIASGHNGYLDLLVQVGVPGLLVGLVAAVGAPLTRFLLDGRLDREKGALLIACFFFVLGHNFTETSLFDRDSIVFVMLLIVVALLRAQPCTVSPAALPVRSAHA